MCAGRRVCFVSRVRVRLARARGLPRPEVCQVCLFVSMGNMLGAMAFGMVYLNSGSTETMSSGGILVTIFLNVSVSLGW